MNSQTIKLPGDAEIRVKAAIASLQRGGGVVLTDDEDRENESDLIYAAESITAEQMNKMIVHCSGIVCLCLTSADCQGLGLSQMVTDNSSVHQTAFTVSIDAKNGIYTGVSASDRVATVKAALSGEAEQLARPGHIFPLQAREGGVLVRGGHTEGTVDLMRMAGLYPSGLLCELMNRDGSMMRLPEALGFAEAEQLPLVTVADLRAVLKNRKSL